MIPYDHIIETADRRWTARLPERLSALDLSDEELDRIVEALQTAADPRSFGTQEAMLLDAARPARIHEAAGAVLRGLHHVALDVPAERLPRWWREGDAILRRHALLSMDDIRCPDIVVHVASDPTYPLQADPLGRMNSWFDLPGHEAIKIAGLSHPNPKVRATAAYVLLWDEPVAAEGPLIKVTHDPAHLARFTIGWRTSWWDGVPLRPTWAYATQSGSALVRE